MRICALEVSSQKQSLWTWWPLSCLDCTLYDSSNGSSQIGRGLGAQARLKKIPFWIFAFQSPVSQSNTHIRIHQNKWFPISPKSESHLELLSNALPRRLPKCVCESDFPRSGPGGPEPTCRNSDSSLVLFFIARLVPVVHNTQPGRG